MPFLPQDYIHYVRFSFVDAMGIEHIIYPARYTSKPSESILQDDDYNYLFDADGSLLTGTPVINDRFTSFDNRKFTGEFGEEDMSYDANTGLQKLTAQGGRKGINPETSQKNGVFIIDELNGKISFDNTSFYSDSINDLPLLAVVSKPVAVNPDDMLRKECRKRSWEIIDLP